ncbi:hypothetical protein RND81_03G173900 [Saponaria officinalis]|uniref:60S ribosomal export protein NMD3 n=1 Tax=Saponaria officinalis TaxID=3572 RepID=A0AAW1MBG5_SAPOF
MCVSSTTLNSKYGVFLCQNTTHSCSSQDPASQCTTTTVQLRQCVSNKQRLDELVIYRLGKQGCELAFKRCKTVDQVGLDTYFDTESDALMYFDFLCSRVPIRPDKLIKSPSNGNYITAMVCPISREDLIYLRSDKLSARLGSLGPLMICKHVTNTIFLLDPLTLTLATVSAVEYWNEPTAFEIYKSAKDLVEYIVLGVTKICGRSFFSLADVDVARVADFGKNDIVFTIRTHLGYLKPGDRAFGYDLYGTNNNATMMGDESKGSLPDVVLVKRKRNVYSAVSRMNNASPEYEEFLRDLEDNPEAMFRLSLNDDNKAEKQQTGIDLMKEEEKKSGFDLEGLLADLALGEQQHVCSPGRSDERHR